MLIFCILDKKYKRFLAMANNGTTPIERVPPKNNIENEKSKLLPEYLDLYRDWRKAERNQLGLSANLYMVFASAILGYTVNLLVTEKEEVGCASLVILSIGICFLLLSLIFYGWFTQNRLADFRKTAQHLNDGKTEHEAGKLTRKIGECTWNLYYLQLLWLVLGFVFSLIGVGIFIYS